MHFEPKNSIRRRFLALGVGFLLLSVVALSLDALFRGSRPLELRGLANVGEGPFTLINSFTLVATTWLYVWQDRWSRWVTKGMTVLAILGFASLPVWLPLLSDFFSALGGGGFGFSGSPLHDWWWHTSRAITTPVVLLLTATVIAPLIYLLGMPALRAHLRLLANPPVGFHRAEYDHFLTLHPRRNVFDAVWRRSLDSYLTYRAALRVLGEYACARWLTLHDGGSSAVAMQRMAAWREVAPLVLSRHPNAAELATSDDIVRLIAALREVLVSSAGFGPGVQAAIEKQRANDAFALTPVYVHTLGMIASRGLNPICHGGYSPAEAVGVAALNHETAWPSLGSPS